MNETTQRAMRARMAAHIRWSREKDRTAATEAARLAAAERFEKQVDPDGVLSAEDRMTRANSARQAHMLKMSLRSAQVRESRQRVRRREETPRAGGLRDSVSAEGVPGVVQEASGDSGTSEKRDGAR